MLLLKKYCCYTLPFFDYCEYESKNFHNSLIFNLIYKFNFILNYCYVKDTHLGDIDFATLLCSQKTLFHNVKFWIVASRSSFSGRKEVKWSFENLMKVSFDFDEIISDLTRHVFLLKQTFPNYKQDFLKDKIEKETTVYMIYNYITELLGKTEKKLSLNQGIPLKEEKNDQESSLSHKFLVTDQKEISKQLKIKNENIKKENREEKKDDNKTLNSNQKINKRKDPLESNYPETAPKKIKPKEIKKIGNDELNDEKEMKQYNYLNDKIKIAGKVYKVPKKSWYYADTECWNDFEMKVKNAFHYKWQKITDPIFHNEIDNLKLSSMITGEKELDYQSDEHSEFINRLKNKLEMEYFKKKQNQ